MIIQRLEFEGLTPEVAAERILRVTLPRKRNAWGLERRSVKAATDWITIDAPQLRIVTDAQWIAAHGRLEQTRQTYLRGTHGQLWGRPVDGHESKYLLTGMSRAVAYAAAR